MGKKIFLGGLVGGVVVFAVLNILHLATPLGEVGIHYLPEEGAVVSAMRGAVRESGFYFFPGMARTPGMTRAQQQAEQAKWAEKYREGPWGILIYHTGGAEFRFGKLLAIQFGICLLAAFLIAWMLATAAGGLASYGSRVGFVALPSLFAGVFVDLPYWNWYGFPSNYTLVHIVSNVVAWGIAGLAMAKIVKAS